MMQGPLTKTGCILWLVTFRLQIYNRRGFLQAVFDVAPCFPSTCQRVFRLKTAQRDDNMARVGPFYPSVCQRASTSIAQRDDDICPWGCRHCASVPTAGQAVAIP